MKTQKTQTILTAVFILALILSGCQRIPGLVTTPPSPTQTEILPQTGGSPIVIAKDQESDGRKVVIEEVFSNGGGWVAIHIQTNGGVGESIGHAAVADGINKNVVVELDPAKATETMYAMLHIDAGEVGVYEFPGADVPEVGEAQYLAPSFKVTFVQPNDTVPVIDVLDQEIKDGTVHISFIVSPEDGWVVIFDDHGDKYGDPVGWAAVKAGENLDVVVPVNPNHLSEKMYARLFSDAGVKGTLELPTKDNPDGGADTPLVFEGQEIVRPFFNGVPVAANTTTEPGQNGDGQGSPDATAGATPTADSHDHMVVPPGAEITPSLEVLDQDVTDGFVDLGNVVSYGPGWVAIYTDNGKGEPDERLGYTQVKNGDNPDVTVQIDVARVTPVLHAILHADTGTEGTFEFPNNDPPVHVGIQMIRTAFRTSPETAETGPTAEPTPMVVSVRVDDQPMRGGSVIIQEAVSDGPGWVGLHLANEDGSLSHTVIAAAHLEPGINRNVVVRFPDFGRATEKMYAMLHADKGIIGDYEYPNPHIDIPVLLNGAEVLDEFQITGGIYGSDLTINLAGQGATPYLVDAAGYSMYILSVGECDAECQNLWLPVLVTGRLTVGNGVDPSKLGFIALDRNRRQATYGNLPLYYFVSDFNPGDTEGQGKDGAWFLARP